MQKRKNNRQSNEVNAGSMADIAFLLLIFFLVTTTIINDQGILVTLPPYKPDTPVTPLPEHNVLTVKVNKHNALLVEQEITTVDQLRELTQEFILNPTNNKKLASDPKKAVVSLQNDRETSYKIYLTVYNELKAAYREMWNDRALQNFGKPYLSLNGTDQKSIRNQIPLTISEAEPTEL